MAGPLFRYRFVGHNSRENTKWPTFGSLSIPFWKQNSVRLTAKVKKNHPLSENVFLTIMFNDALLNHEVYD